MRDQHGYLSKGSVSKAIYGLVTVMAVLTVMAEHPPDAWSGAATLFGTTLALALADVYAETIAVTLAQRRRLSRDELRAIWDESAPVLVGAQGPTVVLLLAAIGLVSVERAIVIAQVVGLVLLFAAGWQVGRTLNESPIRALLSGCLVAAIGLLIVGIKVVFH